MKKKYITFISALIGILSLGAQTIWNGPSVFFEKQDNVFGVDSLTPVVSFSRQNQNPIYNAANLLPALKDIRPAGTEWAFGTLDNYDTLTYQAFRPLTSGDMAGGIKIIGKDMVVHLIDEDIYLSVKFTSWTNTHGGGGFAYTRSSPTSVSISENDVASSKVSISPNPSYEYIEILGEINEPQLISIIDFQGATVFKKIVSKGEKINIQKFATGTYFVHFENGITKKIIKN